MNVKPQPGQRMVNVFTAAAHLHFGSNQVRLPTLYLEANTLTEAANFLKARSDRIGEIIPGAHLRIEMIQQGKLTEARAGVEPDPLAALGSMMAKSLMEWIQK